MTTVDYTPVLLAQLTDLQMRVTKQDTTIAELKAEVEKLTCGSANVSTGSTIRTSVPLRPKHYNNDGGYPRSYDARDARDSRSTEHGERGGSKRIKRNTATTSYPTMSLSDVLHTNEDITIQVGTGNSTNTTALATFDGTNLTVTKCELIASLVGMKSCKPGEILYRFIDELKNAGHITKTFNIAPWKLCFVERDGVRQSLEQLRAVVG